MHVEHVPNRRSRPTILLREAHREGKKIIKRTIANLTDWPAEKVDALRRVLRGEKLVTPSELFRIERSLPHGHVEIILTILRKLGLDSLIASRRCRERDLVVAMIAERLIEPASKLGTTRLWETSTLSEELDLGPTSVNELYAALDWLLSRQPAIERKLAARHLKSGSLVLYDVSSSSYYGRHCELAQFGHDRDKKGFPIIVYGVLTDMDGRPVAVETYRGNTADPTTVPDQVEKLRKNFGLQDVVLVGDRGMLTQTQIETLKSHPGIGWISCLRSEAIRKLVDETELQPSLFDQVNLAELTSPCYPNERLVACFNPLLAEQRCRKRKELLEATERQLSKLTSNVGRRTKKPMTAAEIGVRVGRVLNRYKMGKHFDIAIRDASVTWSRREEQIAQEAQLDGFYVIRTSVVEATMSAADVVRNYKRLASVERAFRCLKGADLRVRPIFHRRSDRVRAHIFLCMLAYYVEWHLRRALAPLLFEDENLATHRTTRDPVSPATHSPSAAAKKAARRNGDHALQSLPTLLAHLGTRCRNFCRIGEEGDAPSTIQLTEPTALQKKALDLANLFPGLEQSESI